MPRQDRAENRRSKKPRENHSSRKGRGHKRQVAEDRATVDALWGSQVVDQPTQASDHYTTTHKRAKRMRTAMWIGLVGGASSVFLLALATGNAAYQAFISTIEADPGIQDEQLWSPRQALVVDEINRWLNSEEDPLPGAYVIDWNRVVTSYQAPDPEDVDENDPDTDISAISYETHYVDLGSNTGTLFEASVLVGYSDELEGFVASAPSLKPMLPPASNEGDTQAFPGAQDVQESEALDFAVQSFMEAFYSANPSALKVAVGDGREGTGYMPMPAAQRVDASITSTALAPGFRASDEEDAPLPEGVVARVQADITWPPTRVPADSAEALEAQGLEFDGLLDDQSLDDDAIFDDTEADEFDDDGQRMVQRTHRASVEYDVLILEANTQTPRVVAWGPPGTWRTLSEHSNAINRQLTSPDSGLSDSE
ncbi:hypothetical protein [Nesterenkonia rhizosphaerae]|uniref:Uncharacterized protein n=1 Tax=Nesterenkonia rhizosphaerae TaxID=1348272 RepID=A0ABP9G002_9MICC